MLSPAICNLSTTEFFHGMWYLGELGYKLKEHQVAYDEFNNKSEYIINVLHASRGIGKTWYFIYKTFSFAIKNPNSRIVYFTKSRKTATDIFIPTYKIFTEDAPPDLFQWSQYHHRVMFSNGSEIILEGAEDDDNKLRGPYAHMIVCDEAGFWRNLKYAVIDVLLDQARRRDGKIFITTTTPESPGHDFYYFKTDAANHGTYYNINSTKNPMLTPEQLDKIAVAMGGWDSISFRREHLNEDVVDPEKSVIPEFDENQHVIESYERPPFFDCYVMMDLGLNDYTHALFAYYDFEKAKLIIEDEIAFHHKTTDKLASLIKDKESQLWPRHPPKLRVSDNEAQQLYDLAVTHGLSFAPADKSGYDDDAGINNLRLLFQRGKIRISKKCVNLIHQLKVGVWNNRRTDYERLPGAGHLDGIDALKYGVRLIDFNKNPVPINHGLSERTHMNLAPNGNTHAFERLVTWYGNK